jgi:hypothetical protein
MKVDIGIFRFFYAGIEAKTQKSMEILNKHELKFRIKFFQINLK